MDDIASELLLNADESTMADPEDGEDVHSEPGPGSPKTKKRRGLRGLLSKASMQDQLLDKLLQQVIPIDDAIAPGGQIQDTDMPASSMYAQRPGFTIATMSTNFRRFNARIGVVFKFQARMMRLLSWRRTTHTLSFLAVYTFVCLDPYLLTILPPAILLLALLVPSFMARHPTAPQQQHPDPTADAYTSPIGGPPLAPARTVKPVKELSRDFFRNMRDLQNGMEDFSRGHDLLTQRVYPLANFSDEGVSSGIFVLLVAGILVLSVASHLLPWRLVFLSAGWAAIWSGHPSVAQVLGRARRAYVRPREEEARSLWRAFVARDIILDEAAETREVEIFELQRRGHAGEWKGWVFSPSPYDPMSAARIRGDRPVGSRFFEDVLAPEGWEWSEKKWALDLWSREWVEERIITGVEVETEGERWVYDMYNEHEATSGVVEMGVGGKGSAAPAGVSWEEGEEGMGRRGEWRRRRWVRLVRREKLASAS